ncbi:cysteine hydrolase [Candidatus Saccharibacteria bacterium]|nr:cysteine hydrolase [Candidatus Saccharibacteria bacterium]
MKQVLIVIDMQNDFITGPLGTKEAQAIVPNVVKKILSKKWDYILYTMDTHYDHGHYRYEDTLEGEKLPIRHCIIWEDGYNLHFDIILANCEIAKKDPPKIECFRKPTFGTEKLVDFLRNQVADKTIYYKLVDDKVCDLDAEVEICGLCTDICVISNALLLRAAFPNMRITCDSSCCAGVTPEKHAAALEVMRSCQIDVI